MTDREDSGAHPADPASVAVPVRVVRRPRRVRRRRGLGRTAPVLAVAGFVSVVGGFAWAAQTPNTPAGIASGSALADCQAAPISTDWEYAYDSSIPGYRISSVVLDGLQPGCLSKGLRVAVADPTGVELSAGTGLTPGSGTTVSVPLSPGVDLSAASPGQLGVVIHS